MFHAHGPSLLFPQSAGTHQPVYQPARCAFVIDVSLIACSLCRSAMAPCAISLHIFVASCRHTVSASHR
jgi:hypothetical protein